MTFVAGWIAHKMNNEDLGIRSSDKNWDWNQTESLAPWIFKLSRGGLKVPTNEFLSDMECFEYEFIKFHGLHELSRKANIIREFEEILWNKFGPSTRFEYSKKLLSLFARSRTFFRLRNLIQKLKDKKAEQNAKNAMKRQVQNEKKFQARVDKEIETRKRALDNSANNVIPGAGFADMGPLAKKPKNLYKAVKDTRSFKQLGQLTTTNLK